MQLRVKIGEANEKSLKLFEGLAFKKISESVSYFGEWELWFDGVFGVDGSAEGRIKELVERFGVKEYDELSLWSS
jgi:hypothetical protein